MGILGGRARGVEDTPCEGRPTPPIALQNLNSTLDRESCFKHKNFFRICPKWGLADPHPRPPNTLNIVSSSAW